MATYDEVIGGELRPAVKKAIAAATALLAVEDPPVRRAALLYLLVVEVLAACDDPVAVAHLLEAYEAAVGGDRLRLH